MRSNGSAVAGKYAGFLIGRLLDCWVLDKKLESTLSLTTHVYFNMAAATSNTLSMWSKLITCRDQTSTRTGVIIWQTHSILRARVILSVSSCYRNFSYALAHVARILYCWLLLFVPNFEYFTSRVTVYRRWTSNRNQTEETLTREKVKENLYSA